MKIFALHTNKEYKTILINYYINNETERNKIGKEGRDYCLNYHKFSDRVAEVLSSIQK